MGLVLIIPTQGKCAVILFCGDLSKKGGAVTGCMIQVCQKGQLDFLRISARTTYIFCYVFIFLSILHGAGYTHCHFYL